MNSVKLFPIRVNNLIRKNIFSRRGFIRMLFGVDVVASPQVQRYCEWGTIAFRFIIARYIRPGDRILDVGTGAHAILATFVKKHFSNVSVLGTDIVPERISFAKTTAVKNNVDVQFVVSDMFDRITGCFDLILFHPPLCSSDVLVKLGYELKSYPNLGSRRSWSADGGTDGLDVLRAFLNGVAEHLTANGYVAVCANPIHCTLTDFTNLCQKAGLTIFHIHRFLGITNVYVLTSR